MESKRMHIRQLEDQVWLLDDNHESTCYVVCGTERAMVIDTVNGYENLKDIVRTLTDLPLVVVNTHGHCDHILGNQFFEEAWLHPDDMELAKAHFQMIRDSVGDQHLSCCPMRGLSIGQQFDLGGGNVLEAISLRGHTAGSIGLLDRRRRVLFSGDGMNPHIWMQLEESQPIAVLHDTLTHVKRCYGGDFDRVLFGHANDYISNDIIDRLLLGCEQLMRGETAQDQLYHYFGNVCKQHPYHKGHPNDVIVYSDEKL